MPGQGIESKADLREALAPSFGWCAARATPFGLHSNGELAWPPPSPAELAEAIRTHVDRALKPEWGADGHLLPPGAYQAQTKLAYTWPGPDLNRVVAPAAATTAATARFLERDRVARLQQFVTPIVIHTAKSVGVPAASRPELLNDVVAAVVDALKRGRIVGDPLKFTWGVAQHKALDARRLAADPAGRLGTDDIVRDQDECDAVLVQERAQLLHAAVGLLNQADQDLIRARLAGQTWVMFARERGLTEERVRQRFARACDRLRRILTGKV